MSLLNIGKKISYLFIACWIFTACETENIPAENEIPGESNPEELYTMSFNASDNNQNNSRASIDEDNLNEGNKNTFRWDTGDQVMIWSGADGNTLKPCFFETKKGGLSSAYFEYKGEYVDSKKYFGYYPYSSTLDYNNISINVPTDGSISQKELGKSLHLGIYRPMFTEVVNREESTNQLTGLTFKHLTSLLCFKIRNISGKSVNIESITINSSKNVFSSKANLIFNPEATCTFTIDETKTGTSSLSFGENKAGLTWNNEEITWAYLPILPVNDLSGSVISLTLKVDNKEYVSLKVSGNEIIEFKQAHYYIFKLSLKSDGIVLDTTIEEWKPGEDTILPVD